MTDGPQNLLTFRQDQIENLKQLAIYYREMRHSVEKISITEDSLAAGYFDDEQIHPSLNLDYVPMQIKQT